MRIVDLFGREFSKLEDGHYLQSKGRILDALHHLPYLVFLQTDAEVSFTISANVLIV